ncbi:MAG: hypothetical protein R2758_00345 [Bacteroidales bacterium]
MEVHDSYKGLLFRDPVITMGVFDGVHLGHRMLLRRVAEASLTGSDSVAVTFEPHPRIVLSGDPGNLRFLTDLGERIAMLRETGIGHLVVIPFTPELSRMTASAFVDSILCRHLGSGISLPGTTTTSGGVMKATAIPSLSALPGWISGLPARRPTFLTENRSVHHV